MRLYALNGGELEAVLDELAGTVAELADDLAWAGKVLEDELTLEA